MKTIGSMLIAMLLTRREDHFRNLSYGPFRVICGATVGKQLDAVYNAEARDNLTLRQRMLEVEGIEAVTVDEKLSTSIVLVEAK